MRELVALDCTGEAFAAALVRVWDAGDAVTHLDPRLPSPARAAALAALRPTRVVGPGGEESALEGGIPVEDGDAVVVATSGATGEPRGVVLTHAAVEASAAAASRRLGVDAARDRWLACLPLAHVGGLSVVLRAVLTGTPLTVQDGFDPAAVGAAARSGGCTLTSLVPTALARVDVEPFRAVLVGGQAAPPDVPARVISTYGMTETASGVVYDGRPLEGVEVRCADDGEIQLRCPMLARCYRDGVDPRLPGGWFPTGDLGELAGGVLTVHGRRDDLIITGGAKVWPITVERAMAGLPGVADVVVLGQPDPEWGNRVVAVVVPADPGSPPTLEALRAAVKEQLPAYAAPRELRLVHEVPRTALGKARRARLARRL